MVSDGRPLSESLRPFLRDWLDRATIPGLSVAVFDTAAVRYAEGLGERNVEKSAPATPETLYTVLR